MKKSQLRQIIREEIKNTLNEIFEIGDSVMLPNRLSGKITKIEGDEITVNTSRGSGTFHKNNLTLLKKSYRENESTDTHINPMVAKAYREYLKAKEEGDGEKAYRYYSRKLNNTYSTRADRDFIENALRKKYGSALNEIKGFEEFKETGFKLGDKVKFMGSAHPTHIKPIKLTGTIEYFEPADEIGVRVDGYGKFIPFFDIQSNIELVD